MSDECDLDELTAFLEASDDDDDDKEASDSEKSDKDKAPEQADQCDKLDDDPTQTDENDAEIQAFLNASDEDEDDDDALKQEESVAKLDNEAVQSNSPACVDEEFDDFDDGDLEELDEMMSQTGSANAHISNLPENQSEDVAMVATDDVAMETNDDVTMETSDAEHEEDVQDPHDAIKAEMAAMTERMKQLQEMLAKTAPQSSPKSSPQSSSKSSSGKHTHKSTEKKQRSPTVSPRERAKLPSSHHSSEKKQSSHTSSSREKAKTPSSSHSSERKHHSHKSSSKTDRPPGRLTKHKEYSGRSHSNSSHHSSSPSDKTYSKHRTSSQHTSDSKNKLKNSAVLNGHTSELKTASKSFQPSPTTKEVDRKMEAHKVKKSTEITRPKLSLNDENPFFQEKGDNSSSQPPSSFYKKSDAVNHKSVFGESDDSDWEDLAGEEKGRLTEEGQEIKKLLTVGQRKREAHTPNYDPALIKKPVLSRWTDTNTVPKRSAAVQKVESNKPVLDPQTGTVSGKYKVRDEFMTKASSLRSEDERESVTDPFCGIRIINPRISMDEFKRKMECRTMMKISRLLSKYGSSDLQKDNWVTMGVVVHKTEPRQSAAGKAYCIWKLSDLQNCDRTVTFFLFGNVYKEHWKNSLGVVVGLLNPSVMDKAEKNQSEVAITINHPQQLLMIGTSKDLDRCRGTTKAGQPCSSFINKQHGEYCTYHVQSAYRKSSSKRTELQASTGVVPKAFDQKKGGNNGCFFYAGNTFTTSRPQAKSSKDKMTLTKLHAFEAKKAPGKVTTMSLHELEPEDEMRIQKLQEKDKNLLSLLSVPSAGSMNFVKHLVKKDAVGSLSDKEADDSLPIVSVSAKDLLKQHQKDLHEKRREHQQQKALLAAVPTIGKGLSLGQEISLDVPLKKTKVSASSELAKQLAIAKIKAKGGINKEDPNAVKKKMASPEAREKIRKRVADDIVDDGEASTSTADESREPPKKKSKLLGDLDLNSPEVQSLLKKKSKHTGALAEAEAEHEERYFGALEKKERMEDKMAAITEVAVKLYYCSQCKYKNTSLHERCKKENHNVSKFKGTKRFFKCKQCKKRSISFDKLPTQACKECGNTNYERVSMLKERSGPKLESEELCLRGNEQKFLGTLQGKAYLNA